MLKAGLNWEKRKKSLWLGHKDNLATSFPWILLLTNETLLDYDFTFLKSGDRSLRGATFIYFYIDLDGWLYNYWRE